MKSNQAIALFPLAALTVLSPPPAIVVGAATLTDEELASYGLTLDEFNAVRLSESPADFGGLPSAGDTDQLWLDAAAFQYEVAASQPDDVALSSRGYYPFLVCSTEPNLSGSEREERVAALFQNSTGVNASHYYRDSSELHNADDMSCFVMRAYKDTVRNVYAAHPYGTHYMTISPIHSSMKMSENTVEVIQSSGVITTQATDSGNTMQVKEVGLIILLCPGVQVFAGGDIFDDLIASDIKKFVTENGGETVESLSFYNHRVNEFYSGDATTLTDRMAKWSSAVTAVMGWTKDDGSNFCLDVIINDNTVFSVEDIVLQVKMNISIWEGYYFHGISEDDMNTCVWYLTYALALSPQICSLEPETTIKTLCSDGTSDLRQCSSSSRILLGSWIKHGVILMMLLVSLGSATV